jgi:PIF1-like helicase/Helitron helicase-like domain at N-terminus
METNTCIQFSTILGESIAGSIVGINTAVQKAFANGDDGLRKPIVCIACDRFVRSHELKTIDTNELIAKRSYLEPPPNSNLHPDLMLHYSTKSGTSCSPRQKKKLSKCLLSPRSTFMENTGGNHKAGYAICKVCKSFLQKSKMPKFCIANNFAFGTPPMCLSLLTNVELAMITPVKTFGYCFSYTGGVNKQLKGSLSYYKIDKKTLVESAAQFEGLGLNDHVVILFYGALTEKQFARAKQKTQVKTKNIIEATKWLIANNMQWKEYRGRFDEYMNLIKNPALLNNAQIIEDDGDNEDLELGELQNTFQIYYPDGSVSVTSGGQEDIKHFQQIVRNAAEHNFEIEYRVPIYNEAVHDYKDNNLVDACLLQFPYGRGGLQEMRLKSDGSQSDITDMSEYVTYLSMISLPHFQNEHFTLILYNMITKHNMVKTAGWKVRNKRDATVLGMQLTIEDIDDAIENSRAGQNRTPTNSHSGHKLLGAIDTICKSIPHSNKAAKKARREVETMQHHFGCPSFFLTITPDDNNHIFIQIYSGSSDERGINIEQQTDEEIHIHTKKRGEMRINYPGVCALFYETAIDIVLKNVIGWDKQKHEMIKGFNGAFGQVEALSISTEEQGRRTLHAHILIWVLGLNLLREDLFSESRCTQRHAASLLIPKIDTVIQNSCFFNGLDHRTIMRTAFPHYCSKTGASCTEQYPTIVDDQSLRQLRCRDSSAHPLVYCKNCTKTWSQTELITSFLEHGIKMENTSNSFEKNVNRLKSLAVHCQAMGKLEEPIPMHIINCSYNHHVHTSSCFKRKCEVSSNSDACDECRYRYPQRKKRKTTIENVSEEPKEWYEWNGSKILRHTKEVCIKRAALDAFQNNCCPQISFSQLSCNTNVSFVMPGPLAQYCVNYTMKNTQKDDTSQYRLVRDAAEKALLRLKHHSSPSSEAIRRVLATSFAHQSENIVGAAMAAHLTRIGSRFYFSHEFSWCPLRDIKVLLNGGAIHVSLSVGVYSTYFQCQALNYLCRPTELENLSAYEFFAGYDIRTNRTSGSTAFLYFANTLFFKHPSYVATKDRYKQGVVKRLTPKLVKIFQYDFPDTASFGGDLLCEDDEITDQMEKFSEQSLLLFLPHRQQLDLVINQSFTKRLRSAIQNCIILHSSLQILQNIQDAKSNNLRSAMVNDDLQRHTHAPTSLCMNPQSNVEILNEVQLQANDVQIYHKNFDQYFTEIAENDIVAQIPLRYNCCSLRGKGRFKCGYDRLPSFDSICNYPPYDFIHTSNNNDTNCDLLESSSRIISNRGPATQQRLVRILFKHDCCELRSFEIITGQHEETSVLKPNGSVSSIIDWARKSNLDASQQRAFEIFAGTFVLACFNEALYTPDSRHEYISAKRRLQYLIHRNKWKTNQLICLLHGPAGSGKTAVIDLVMLYCKSYCSYIWKNFQSTERVIVVTAMTGVAATLLGGETAHSALYLNQKRDINAEQVELWSPTKLVIVDEISFASKQDIATMHKQLSRLKEKIHSRYGGINIIFSGDFRQLEPVGQFKRPIYAEAVPEFVDWINCFIELNGTWRFRTDVQWGTLLARMRNGTMTTEDVNLINCQIKKKTKIPADMRYATYFNVDRDAINTAIFEERARHCYQHHQHTNGYIMIFADNILMKNSSNIYKKFCKPSLFWEKCGENEIVLPQGAGRMDPVLKLYVGCRVMLPVNIRVSNGQANGTQAIVVRIVLKNNETPSSTNISERIPVCSIFASQVDYILLRHLNTRQTPSEFKLKVRHQAFKTKLPNPLDITDEYQLVEMKATQLPILVNNATTGHKLQGSGVDQLFVHNWSYTTNWAYVMLSRVKTLSGLYARHMIDTDLTKYLPNKKYHNMIAELKSMKPCTFSNYEYSIIQNGSLAELQII